MKIRRTGFLMTAPLAILLACGSAEEPAPLAPPATPTERAEQSMSGSPAGHEAGDAHAGHQEPAAAPADLASAWAELLGLRGAIAADVEAGALGEIHAKSERLAPLANAVLEHSSQLAGEQRARVESAVKQIPAVAGKLHEAADGGDAGATRNELGRLDAVLELMRAQYPAGALDASAPAVGGAHDAAMHPHGTTSAFAGHEHATRPLAAVDTPAQAMLVVISSEFAFEPKTLELRAGVPTRIELDNRAAAVEHSLLVTAPAGGDWIHLHAQAKGTDSGTYRIDVPGSYEVLCTIPGHTEAGMVGTLVVAAR